MNWQNITECRLCNGIFLEEVLRFAPQYFGFCQEQPDNPPKVPMTVLLCDDCGLVQLRETTKPELLYTTYYYRSNVSQTMNKDLQDVVIDAMSWVDLKESDSVLDIGCNDGLMLTFYPKGVYKFGLDPAENIDRSDIKFDDDTKIIQGYFPDSIEGGQFKIITATAMFYDLNEPNEAVRQIKSLLHPEGIALIQVSYLYDTIRDMNFYDFCHEHLEYYSLKTLKQLFEHNGMKILDASTNAVNGGSLRVIVGHSGEPTDNVQYLLTKEKALRLDDVETYKIYGELIDYSARKVSEYIRSQVQVIALGASTKGNVLMQICGLTKEDLPYISERSPHKWGWENTGIGMKLVSEAEARKLKPDCMFVVPWNFTREIVDREQGYLDNGGKLLFIMPYPYVLDKEGEHRL